MQLGLLARGAGEGGGVGRALDLTSEGFVGGGEGGDRGGLSLGAGMARARSIVDWRGEVVIFRKVRCWGCRSYRVIVLGLRGRDVHGGGGRHLGRVFCNSFVYCGFFIPREGHVG